MLWASTIGIVVKFGDIPTLAQTVFQLFELLNLLTIHRQRYLDSHREARSKSYGLKEKRNKETSNKNTMGKNLYNTI